MIYGVIDLRLLYSGSLKDKRKIVQAIIARNRSKYNISITEVDYHDLWQRSLIGFTAVVNNTSGIDAVISTIEKSVYSFDDEVELLLIDHQIITYE
ncbi:MAG: DUF503 domain-containing protein [Syntrophomonadaceae bacterium]|nr:DUF503 domain-containing protein [Syntrophomonadaceae bacterium]